MVAEFSHLAQIKVRLVILSTRFLEDQWLLSHKAICLGTLAFPVSVAFGYTIGPQTEKEIC